ncbi:hypothetical protein DS742_14780 [Lacrimispora amygdalina]|uniref:DUF2812 domain-containing protein n=1 Tax=Lacrimispora amygdalina TaxID=253257 RepID=A0A3E2NB99_9FIRM|nr:hypothetical protein [Clostridium indicum]RFZ78151.1 hypothetical protein DS742_14780 [Clostridium indicum]
MFERQKNKCKIVYNNYQFYENTALSELIEKQMNEGYYLCGIIGESSNILKFCYDKTKKPESCIIYHKHLDEKIDAEIEKMKAEKMEMLCQNNHYIIFGIPSSEADGSKSDIVKKQNKLLGIPLKKSAALILILLILSIISLVLKILLIDKGNLYFNQMSLVLYLALNIVFLLYFAGDIYDIIQGKGICSDGIMYFSSRTKFKDILFRMGDILRLVILLGSICISAAILIFVKDGVIAINVLKMWLIYCTIGYIYRLRIRSSYLSVLLIQVFLAALSF